MLRRTIPCVDPAMNALQAPQVPPERLPDQPAAAPDAQPVENTKGEAATPKPALPPRVTGEDMSGWASGGSD